MPRTRAIVSALVAAAVTSITPAIAQPTPAPVSAQPTPVDAGAQSAPHRARVRLVLGLGGSVGDASCAGCGIGPHAAGFELRAGASLTPRLAALAELWLVGHAESFGDEDVAQRHVFALVAVQRWLIPRLWLKAGIGLARGSIAAESPMLETVATRVGFALAVGAGYDVAARGPFVLDAHAHGVFAALGDQDDLAGGARVGRATFAIGLGVTWR